MLEAGSKVAYFVKSQGARQKCDVASVPFCCDLEVKSDDC